MKKFTLKEVTENNAGRLQLNFVSPSCELCDEEEKTELAIPLSNGVVVFCGMSCFMKLVEMSNLYKQTLREQAQALINKTKTKRRGRPRKVS